MYGAGVGYTLAWGTSPRPGAMNRSPTIHRDTCPQQGAYNAFLSVRYFDAYGLDFL